MTTDPIANLLNIIKNGYSQQKDVVRVPLSQLKLTLCRILKKEGYLRDFKADKQEIKISLHYQQELPAISHIRRISKPSRRFYTKAKNIPRPSQGKGIIILSTPKGIMTHIQAKKQHLGGEIICEVA